MELNFGKKKAPEPEATKPPDLAEQTKQVSGFSNIAEVRSAAPEKSDIAMPSGSTPVPVRTLSKQAKAAMEKAQQEAVDAAKREKSRELVGRHLLNKIAKLPYSVWAYLAADPSLALSPEEQKDLADAYYMLAQAYDVDFSKPAYAMLVVMAAHADILTVRLERFMPKEVKDALTELKTAAGVN